MPIRIRSALSAMPDHEALSYQSLNVAPTTGDAETTISSLKTAIKLQPIDLDAWLQILAIALQTGQTPHAARPRP